MLAYALVLVIGLLAGTLSGIIGTGASILLIPVLVFAFGPKEAIPIMAVAGIMGNIGKVLAWRKEVDWRAFAAYSVTGIPAAALGADTLLSLPAGVVDLALGAFFLLMIPVRRWLAARSFRLSLAHLALIGAVIGYITGVVVSTGPLSVAAFAAYGLVKGAFLATEAAASLAVFASKVATFRVMDALPLETIVRGLITGSALAAGAFAARSLVVRLSPGFFQLLLDGLLLCSGVTMLWIASR
jgi:uncharacterized membrane protein YfcA